MRNEEILVVQFFHRCLLFVNTFGGLCTKNLAYGALFCVSFVFAVHIILQMKCTLSTRSYLIAS